MLPADGREHVLYLVERQEVKTLIRLLTGVALLGAALAYDVSPASADHGVAATDEPCPGDSGTAGDNCWHEEQPDFAIAQPSDPCVVTGTVDPGNPPIYKTHFPSVPLVNDDPSHSHFAFIDSIINCPLTDGALSVTAEGGNDGHMIDILGDPDTLDTTPLEVDLDDRFCSTVYPSLCMGVPVVDGGRQHEFDHHHGAVGESGWSHSSLYSGGAGGGESNVCSTIPTTRNQNKADININGNSGWVKYVRIGVVVYAWGCVLGLAPNQVFSSVLLILPNVLPVGVPGLYPGGVLNPLCLLGLTPCGFILAGTAWRGSAWI